jgi:hypothetical protein
VHSLDVTADGPISALVRYSEADMSVPFRLIGNQAELEVDVDGHKVRVAVVPKPGTKITAEDADVILTSAMGAFPQRIRFPEPLNGGRR